MPIEAHCKLLYDPETDLVPIATPSTALLPVVRDLSNGPVLSRRVHANAALETYAGLGRCEIPLVRRGASSETRRVPHTSEGGLPSTPLFSLSISFSVLRC